MVDGSAVVAFPVSPLCGVDGAEVAVFVCPFVPDVDVVFFEPGVVGVAGEEPEEFAYYPVEVDFFGGDEGEGFLEVVAELSSEYAECSGAGAVCFLFSVFEDVGEEVFVWCVDFCHVC